MRSGVPRPASYHAAAQPPGATGRPWRYPVGRELADARPLDRFTQVLLAVTHRPHITAEVTFLRTEEGGRAEPPIVNPRARYKPHIVIQGRDVRQAVVDADRVIWEPYQGVAFIEGPRQFQLGDTGTFVLDLIYYPEEDYADVHPGATFTVREGAKVVAHGVVLGRSGSPAT